jgi:hypothetical protein
VQTKLLQTVERFRAEVPRRNGVSPKEQSQKRPKLAKENLRMSKIFSSLYISWSSGADFFATCKTDLQLRMQRHFPLRAQLDRRTQSQGLGPTFASGTSAL